LFGAVLLMLVSIVTYLSVCHWVNNDTGLTIISVTKLNIYCRVHDYFTNCLYNCPHRINTFFKWYDMLCNFAAAMSYFLSFHIFTEIVKIYIILKRFYPRDAMLPRVFLTATCPSVRLSVTRRYCIKTKKASVMISSPSGSPTILVFWCQISSWHSKGFPRAGPQTRVGWDN